MAEELGDWELPSRMRPKQARYGFELDRTLDGVLSLSSAVPEDAFTAGSLGTERIGSGVLIREEGVVLTIGYLVTEAERVTLGAANGQVVPGHVLGVDAASGFGLVQALEPLDVDPVPVGSSASLDLGETVIMAGGGRRGRALESRLQARQEFAGYWEYLLEEALFTAPAHPLWSGAAMISAEGELVGIGSLRLEQQEEGGEVTPFNMSVPAELLAPIYDDLVQGKPAGAPRPWLGLLAQHVGDAVAVIGVSDRAPASRAELRPGDAILAVAGERVSSLAAFYRRLWSLGPPGVDVPLTLQRGSDVFDVEVRSADRRQLLKRSRYN